jgi:basic membrane lipoprotein Med (substrate-binding protein (PBP1-ABC) superfamily)
LTGRQPLDHRGQLNKKGNASMNVTISRWFVMLGVGMLVAFGGLGEAGAQGKHKMAMILPGTIQDADFNTLGYVALQDVAKTLGVPVAHSENVAVADAERVSREYIASGHDIVAYHGGQFITIMQKLSAQFPKVVFIQEASGRVPNTGGNVWIIGRKYYQGYYALGALAALATKTNKIGLVGGVRIPDVISSTNAVLMAVKEYNPKAEVVYNFVGDFNDPVKARQTAEAQLAAGADFLVTFVNLGVYGVAEAVKVAPKPALITTLYTEKWDSAPKHMTVSLLFDFARPYREIVGRILKGEQAGYYEMRPGSGFELSDIRQVSPEVAGKVKALFREIAAGKSLPEITDKIITP